MLPSEIYQHVTDKIVAQLEKGAIPWVQPWHSRADGLSIAPHNITSKRRYQGVNVLILSMQQMSAGYSTGAWATFNQIKALNGYVRKGEKATAVVYFKAQRITETDPVTGEKAERTVPLMRTYYVFNLDQTDGIKRAELIKPANDFLAVPDAESTIQRTGAKIEHGGDSAFYSPGHDVIRLPKPADFFDPGHYYATAFHELTHWTGHPSRLQREYGRRFGDDAYAFEELVAELGAAFLCAGHEIAGELRHAGYIESWLRVLRQDSKAIFRASALAQKAADFITGAKPAEEAGAA